MKIYRMVVGLILAVVLAGTAGGLAYADQNRSNPFTGDAPSHPLGPVSGNVVSVDYGRNQLTVASHGRNIVVIVLPSTAIYRGEKYAGLTDLQAGMHVDISVNQVDGNVIAQIIRIR
jgi:hypothetical protein